MNYILQYISNILKLSLTLDKKVDILNNIVRYTHFDFAELKPNWKLTKDYIFILTKATINYSSRL